VIITTTGQRVDISRQIDDLVWQSQRQSYNDPHNIQSAHNLGRRLAIAAGTYALPEILHAIVDDLDPAHHGHLTDIWTAVIDEIEADDEDCVPSHSDLIVGFETTWGTGSWDRCEAAARAALRVNCRTDRDRLTVQHLSRHGIGTDMAAAWLVLALEPARPGRPRAGQTKRRLGCG
jgi:hypothetical protein